MIVGDEIQALSAEQPWPGLSSFTEEGADFFHGREEETAELVRLIRRTTFTVLFGQSGLGKSSLIRAGAFPLLRAGSYFPVYIRLDHSEDAPALHAQVMRRIAEEAAAHRIDAVLPEKDLGLWEYFHTKRHEFWNERNELLTALLIFDQFEELFTLGRASAGALARTEALVKELGDLVENRVPDAVSLRAETDDAFARSIEYGKEACKVLITLREDFLPEFEGLRREIPSSIQNRMRLKPMTGRQALRAVKETGGDLVTEEVAEQIVRFVAGPRADQPDLEWERIDIEPALLSVVCRELNARRLREAAAGISGDLLGSGAQTQIIAQFYDRSFDGLDDRLKRFVEDRLLTASGHRDSVALEDATAAPGVTREGVDRLIARRVLRLEERFGVLRVELTHDLLTRVIRDSRDQRAAHAAEEAAVARAAAETRRFRQLTITAAVLGAGVLATGFLLLKTLQSERLLTERSKAVLSQKLAATSRALAEREPDVGWLLGAEALRVTDTPEARRNLIELAAITDPTLQHYFPRVDAGRVLAIAIAHDGTVAVTGHKDGAVVLWDLSANRPRHVLRDHRGDVLAVALSPDGRIAYTGADNGGIRIWDTTSGLLLGRFFAKESAVTAVAVSPDGLLFSAGFADGTLAVRRATAPFAPVTSTVESSSEGRINALAFTARPDRLLSGSQDGTLSLWDTATGRKLSAVALGGGVVDSGEKALGKGGVIAIRQAAGGSASIAVDQSGVARRFSIANDRIVVTAVANLVPPPESVDHPGQLETAAVSADGNQVALAFSNGGLVVWKLDSPSESIGTKARPTIAPGSREHLRQGNQQRIPVVAFLPDSKGVISASGADAVVRSSLERTKASRQRINRSRVSGSGSPRTWIAPSRSRVVARLSNTEVEVINLVDRRIERILRHDATEQCATPFFADGERTIGLSCWPLAGANYAKDLRRTRTVDLSTGKTSDALGARSRLSEDNRYALRRDTVVDLSNGATLFNGVKISDTENVRFTIRSENGLAVFLDQALVIRNARSGEVRKEVPFDGKARGLWTSADGGTILFARTLPDRPSIALEKWATDSIEKKGEWLIAGDAMDIVVDAKLSAVAFRRGPGSQSGWFVLSLGGGTGRDGAQRLAGSDRVSSAQFSPDGQLLLTRSDTLPPLALWDVSEARRFDAPFSNMVEDEMRDISGYGFVEDGATLFALTSREVVFQDANIGARSVARACSLANRNLTREEWKRYLGSEPYRETCPK